MFSTNSFNCKVERLKVVFRFTLTLHLHQHRRNSLQNRLCELQAEPRCSDHLAEFILLTPPLCPSQDSRESFFFLYHWQSTGREWCERWRCLAPAGQVTAAKKWVHQTAASLTGYAIRFIQGSWGGKKQVLFDEKGGLSLRGGGNRTYLSG